MSCTLSSKGVVISLPHLRHRVAGHTWQMVSLVHLTRQLVELAIFRRHMKKVSKLSGALMRLILTHPYPDAA